MIFTSPPNRITSDIFDCKIVALSNCVPENVRRFPRNPTDRPIPSWSPHRWITKPLPEIHQNQMNKSLSNSRLLTNINCPMTVETTSELNHISELSMFENIVILNSVINRNNFGHVLFESGKKIMKDFILSCLYDIEGQFEWRRLLWKERQKKKFFFLFHSIWYVWRISWSLPYLTNLSKLFPDPSSSFYFDRCRYYLEYSSHSKTRRNSNVVGVLFFFLLRNLPSATTTTTMCSMWQVIQWWHSIWIVQKKSERERER